ncbi:MAG: NosD domain-containing protein [Methanothrix sp.]|nr:NosD domain-containing protein [Methanothrix sp.]
MLRNDVYKRFFVISAIVLITSVGQTLGATYVVSPDYEDKFIQATINRAGYGDRIIVKSGLYTENLNVTKKVALIGLDTGGGKPVVNAGGLGSAVVISADGVLFEGFEVTNSGKLWKDAGIKVKSKNCIIRNNNITKNEYGIVLDGSARNNILKNSVCLNDVGISLYSSDGCTILDNVACKNTFGGILLSRANNNTIRRNNASLNRWAGIILGECSNNSVSNNIARYNDNEGIWLLRSAANTIRGNNVRYNYIFGIRLFYSNRNAVTSNIVRNNLDGVSIENSNGNILAGNNLSINDYGIYVDNSFNNRIYMNNLINNQNNAHSWNSTNFWNSTELITYSYNGVAYKRYVGNYWSGYFGPDPFGDGLGDLPQTVVENVKDYNPLKKPSEKYTMHT